MKRALVLIVLAACDADGNDAQRREYVQTMVDRVIVPGYQEVAARAAALRDAEKASDGVTVSDLQERWKDLRVAWMVTQAHRVGPVRDLLFESRIAQWPVDTADVEALIASDAVIDRALIDAQGANRKGIVIAEYLLFTGDLTAPRRRAYLSAVLDAIADETAGLAAAWTGGYAAQLTALPVKEGVDALVNANVFAIADVADRKLGQPLGSQTGGAPQVDLVVSPWSDHGVPDVLGEYAGLRRMLVGPEPEGVYLAQLLVAAKPGVFDRLRDELDAAQSAMLAVPRPLTDAVLAKAPEADAAWTAARAVKLTYRTEVISALGVTLSFNDNDGD